MPAVGAGGAGYAPPPPQVADPTQALRPPPPGVADATQALRPVGAPPYAADATQALHPGGAAGYAADATQALRQASPAGSPAYAPQQARYDAGQAAVPGFGDAAQPPRFGYPPPTPIPDLTEPGPQRPRRGRLLLAVGGLIVVLVVVVAVALSSDGSSPSHPSAQATTAVPATSAATPTAVATTFASQAAAMNSVLQASTTLRSQVTNAVVGIEQCGDVGGAAATLQNAATQRDGLIQQLNGMNVSQLGGGVQLVTDFKAALTASATSDRAFAAWAGDVSGSGCGGGKGQANMNDPNYHAAASASADAGVDKSKVVAEWRPIAEQAGFTPVTANQI